MKQMKQMKQSTSSPDFKPRALGLLAEPEPEAQTKAQPKPEAQSVLKSKPKPKSEPEPEPSSTQPDNTSSKSNLKKTHTYTHTQFHKRRGEMFKSFLKSRSSSTSPCLPKTNKQFKYSKDCGSEFTGGTSRYGMYYVLYACTHDSVT